MYIAPSTHIFGQVNVTAEQAIFDQIFEWKPYEPHDFMHPACREHGTWIGGCSCKSTLVGGFYQSSPFNTAFQTDVYCVRHSFVKGACWINNANPECEQFAHIEYRP